jgi:hypothetical protein
MSLNTIRTTSDQGMFNFIEFVFGHINFFAKILSFKNIIHIFVDNLYETSQFH